jgi:hypothetical protein
LGALSALARPIRVKLIGVRCSAAPGDEPEWAFAFRSPTGEESDEGLGRVRLSGANNDATRRNRDFLNLGWQRPDQIDPGYGPPLDNLLKADLGLAARNNDGDAHERLARFSIEPRRNSLC